MGSRAFDVCVVGGGATGTGLARDLAMRGLRCLLVEMGDLANGTSGHFHGLLHSGARYVVRDPISAAECRRENAIVRRIAAPMVEDTGGLFCWLRGDPEDYPPRFLEGCRRAGIEVEEITVEKAHRREPLLSDAVERAFWVPDATIDPWALVAANAASAMEHGAEVRRYTRLAGAELRAGRVLAVELVGVRSGERERVEVGLLASAAGHWAGRIAAMLGVELKMAPGWGAMVVMNQRLSQAVVNRCRLPGDGDIVVPVGPVSILGTTSHTLDLLEGYEVTQEEVRHVMKEAARLVPSVLDGRPLRVYAGARPLYDPGHDPAASRSLTRSHTVLDHGHQGVDNFVSIVGGKLTTYRLMAEDAADLICRKLGVSVPCRTAEEPLPAARRQFRHFVLGDRLTEREMRLQGADADLVCECELVSSEAVRSCIRELGLPSLHDMLRALRLGMGPCQGGFCTLRAAGLLAELTPGLDPLAPARDFLEERFRGQRPLMWGDQVRQFRLNEIVHREVLALDHAQ